MDELNAVQVFVSNHDHSLSPERALLRRVLSAFSASTFAEDLSASQVYVGLFGSHAESATVRELESAIRAQKTCWLFVKDHSQRAPELEQLLEHLAADYPPHLFRSPAELSQQFLPLLQQHLAAQEGWSLPPLPLRDPFFIGREGEMARLRSLFNSTQPVTLYGESGVGKSALALELAYQVREHFSGGIFWLSGLGKKTGQSLTEAFHHLASAHPSGRAALAEGREIGAGELRGWLAEAGGRVLVIADDIRHMNPIRDLRAALPTTYSILITSPSPLHDVGWNPVELGPLSQDESLRLLAHYLDSPAGLAPEALRPLETIAQLLEGYPLALRLSAGWMRRAGGWQAALIYQNRLLNGTQALQVLAPNISHQHPIEKTLAIFYNSLAPRQREIFRAGGVFAPESPFSAEALWATVSIADFAQDLSNLAPAYLQPDDSTGDYYLHERLQNYAQALTPADEAQQFQIRHLSYYELQCSAEAAAPDLRQIRRAFQTASQSAPAILVQYVLKAGQYLQSIHHYSELRDWLDQTLEAIGRNSAQYYGSEPTSLRALGDLSQRIHHTMAAQEFYEGALLLYYEQKSLSGQANTLKALGDLRAEQGHLSEAQEFYDRTLLLYAQIDFQLGRANTLKAMGDLSLKAGDFLATRNYYQRTLELYEQIDFQLGQAHTLKAMGDLHLQERDMLSALQDYQSALRLYQEIQFHSQQAATLLDLGRLAQMTAYYERALEHYEAALKLYRFLEDEKGQAYTLELIGDLYADQGHPQHAQSVWEEARHLHRQKKSDSALAALDLKLSEVYWSQGKADLAMRAALESIKLYRRLEDKDQLQAARRNLRQIAQALGGGFAPLWNKLTHAAELPDWLKLPPPPAIEQRLIYAVRDFMLAGDLEASQQILTQQADILLTDEADEVLAQMLRQYAGQTGPTRQVDRYRALLQRVRQIGIEAAFAEVKSSKHSEQDNQARRLHQTLDNYDEALARLGDIPLVYASIQLNRANTLRELASLPRQDQFVCLQNALAAYDDALHHQESEPLHYAQTQILRAETLRELSQLPDADIEGLLKATLAAYTDALQYQHDLPQDYALTQLYRADTLYELAQLNSAPQALYQALEAYDEALHFQQQNPLAYARTQSHRAQVLYALAGIPHEDFIARMKEALAAYDEALAVLRDEDTLEYARTLTNRVALLRDLAGLPGEDRGKRLYEALASSNESLRFLLQYPADYAKAQINRAHLQRELAGLRGENRLARMRESLATYTEVLKYLSELPLDYASVQNARASLLREMSTVGGEAQTKRLREALESLAEALLILERLPEGKGHLLNTRRLMNNIRREILNTQKEGIFERWWFELLGTVLPTWLED